MEGLSSYAKSLTAASKERYKEKISLIIDFLKDETSLSLPENSHSCIEHHCFLYTSLQCTPALIISRYFIYNLLFHCHVTYVIK